MKRKSLVDIVYKDVLGQSLQDKDSVGSVLSALSMDELLDPSSSVNLHPVAYEEISHKQNQHMKPVEELIVKKLPSPEKLKGILREKRGSVTKGRDNQEENEKPAPVLSYTELMSKYRETKNPFRKYTEKDPELRQILKNEKIIEVQDTAPIGTKSNVDETVSKILSYESEGLANGGGEVALTLEEKILSLDFDPSTRNAREKEIVIRKPEVPLNPFDVIKGSVKPNKVSDNLSALYDNVVTMEKAETLAKEVEKAEKVAIEKAEKNEHLVTSISLPDLGTGLTSKKSLALFGFKPSDSVEQDEITFKQIVDIISGIPANIYSPEGVKADVACSVERYKSHALKESDKDNLSAKTCIPIGVKVDKNQSLHHNVIPLLDGLRKKHVISEDLYNKTVEEVRSEIDPFKGFEFDRDKDFVPFKKVDAQNLEIAFEALSPEERMARLDRLKEGLDEYFEAVSSLEIASTKSIEALSLEEMLARLDSIKDGVDEYFGAVSSATVVDDAYDESKVYALSAEIEKEHVEYTVRSINDLTNAFVEGNNAINFEFLNKIYTTNNNIIYAKNDCRPDAMIAINPALESMQEKVSKKICNNPTDKEAKATLLEFIAKTNDQLQLPDPKNMYALDGVSVSDIKKIACNKELEISNLTREQLSKPKQYSDKAEGHSLRKDDVSKVQPVKNLATESTTSSKTTKKTHRLSKVVGVIRNLNPFAAQDSKSNKKDVADKVTKTNVKSGTTTNTSTTHTAAKLAEKRVRLEGEVLKAEAPKQVEAVSGEKSLSCSKNETKFQDVEKQRRKKSVKEGEPKSHKGFRGMVSSSRFGINFN
jgi:hypothetical protein